jgi:hypothetical protein
MIGGGILSKVIRKLAQKSAHSAGYKGSGVVARDMKAGDKLLEKQLWAGTEHKSYHAKKIHDLATDDQLAPTWIKELITKSKNKEDLNAVLGYLSDNAKTVNLPPGTRKGLMKATMTKIQAIREKELFQNFIDLMEHVRNHSDDLL